MASEPLEHSLPKGYCRQLFAIGVLREKKPLWRWESTRAGGKFDIMGFKGTRGHPIDEVLVEIRYREHISEDRLLTHGVEINANKIQHGIDAYATGVKQCIFLVILNGRGLYTTHYPKLEEANTLEFHCQNRAPGLECSGRPTEVTKLKGFKMLCDWNTYLEQVRMNLVHTIPAECVPFLKEIYG